MKKRDDLATEVLKSRYLMKDINGNIIETPELMYLRAAKFIAAVDKKYGASEFEAEKLTLQFYKLMEEGIFLPNSTTLMNAGREDAMLSACFVIPVKDCIADIFEAVRVTALVQKGGGGTGFTFDNLRPTGDIVASSGGTTSGPISFWKVIAETTNAIQQGAHRRGANMAMMSIEHPDIMKFICAKQQKDAFNNFNISVKVTNGFMDSLRDTPGKAHVVINPRNKKHYVIPKSIALNSYTIRDLRNPDGNTADCFTVQDVWDLIVNNAHATGEPGICFIDRINQDNPTPALGRLDTTNPCGEQPLLDYESCNLGSINVSKFVLSDGSDLDWKKLAEVINLAVRFLDNVIDASSYWPVEKIKEMTLGNRKIGLGVMGFADALILLGIIYGNIESIEFARKLSAFLKEHAHNTSQQLAEERGVFPNWKSSIWDSKYNRPMRNASCTTIAPTGSISIIAKCSSGIEPVFSFAYTRRVLDGEEFIQVHPLLERLGKEHGWFDEKAKIMLLEGSKIFDIPGIPDDLLDTMITAHEVAPDDHIKIQAAFQENIDNAVSKTINLTEETDITEVDKIFRYAYQMGCKGITVFRDRSRDGQIISAVNKQPDVPLEMHLPRARPRIIKGTTIKAKTGCGSLFCTLNKDAKGLFEIFINLGRAGGCPSQSEATARILSIALRSGIKPQILIEQLKGIRCLSTMARKSTNPEIDVLSCPDAIARALEETLGDGFVSAAEIFIRVCPECNSLLRKEAGCNVCDNCGFSKCG
ncbi:MAG: ribonucleoside-diphosphate reductase, adenosylcobalamin-dependent [Planctomycetes bacterium GWF2_41_51]|nr:MAG: ribonucleoside-diphosphate reductase, adenosylcobalamin-dependent [Planctomycetes bacterium GWF2_41_51]HBG25737.1 adenosylcobalamin-dependent ribonucleoside-diphosphate reductase [Phycisphaerales bacterium]